jgi:hypothetical protein
MIFLFKEFRTKTAATLTLTLEPHIPGSVETKVKIIAADLP